MPLEVNSCVGFWSVLNPPSSKSQYHEVGSFALMSVNVVIGSPLKVKSAAGVSGWPVISMNSHDVLEPNKFVAVRQT